MNGHWGHSPHVLVTGAFGQPGPRGVEKCLIQICLILLMDYSLWALFSPALSPALQQAPQWSAYTSSWENTEQYRIYRAESWNKRVKRKRREEGNREYEENIKEKNILFVFIVLFYVQFYGNIVGNTGNITQSCQGKLKRRGWEWIEKRMRQKRKEDEREKRRKEDERGWWRK